MGLSYSPGLQTTQETTQRPGQVRSETSYTGTRVSPRQCTVVYVLVLLSAFSAVRASAFCQAPEAGFELVASIGKDDGEDSYVFGLVSDVAFGPGKSIYVLDAMNAEVRVFDAQGRFLRKFGRKGSGPGEMQFPSRLILRGEDLVVLDPAQRRVVRFDPQGKHLETSVAPSVAYADVVLPMRHGQWLVGRREWIMLPEAGILAQSLSPSKIEREAGRLRVKSAPFIGLARSTSSTIDTLLRYDHGRVERYTEAGGIGSVPRGWGEGGAWTTAGDSIVVLLDTQRGFLSVLLITQSGARVVRRGDLQIVPEPLGPSDWKRMEAQVRRERGWSVGVLHVTGPAYRAQLGAPILSTDGVLWIPRLLTGPEERSRPTEFYYLLIPLDSNAPQSVVRVPSGIGLRAVSGDDILSVGRTALGSQTVQIWRRTTEPPL